jgi:hypothetical protein
MIPANCGLGSKTMKTLEAIHPVFTILLEENPNLFTTEGLERLLMDCVSRTIDTNKIVTHHSLIHECIWTALSAIFEAPGDLDLMRRILVSPAEFDLKPPEGLVENNFYGRLGKVFGADMMMGKFVYDVIRDNIRVIQKQLNISGITERHISICDRTFSFWTESWQLELLESDRITLLQEVPKVVDFFLDVTRDAQYELTADDEEENSHPCNESKLRAIAQMAISARVTSESHEWEKVGSDRWKGRSINRLHPDRITLYLGLSGDENEAVDANHIDKTRQPWFAD